MSDAKTVPELRLPPGQEGEHHLADAWLFQRDLFFYWNALRWQAIPLIAVGFVSKRALKRLNAQLLAPDPGLDAAAYEDESPRLFFLRILLEDLRLIEREGDALRASGPPTTVPDYWRQGLAARTVTALHAWRDSRRWNEAGESALAFPLDRVAARQALLTELRARAEDAGENWISVAGLTAALQGSRPNFLFPDRVRLMGMRSGYYGGSYYSSAGLSTLFGQAEKTFIAQALAGPLHWLGIVDLGAERAAGPRSRPLAERLIAVRVTPAGMRALKGEVVADVQAAGTVIVQPNFQMFALGPVAETVLAELETFADRVRAERGSTEYHLSRASVYRAQSVGYSVEQVLQTLEREAHAELPQNVRRSLVEWAEHHERIVLRQGVTLLEAASPELLDRLLQDETLRKLIGQRVGPQAAIVQQGGQQLRQALQADNLLLATSTGRVDGAVRFSEEGRAHFIHAVPDLRVRSRLARLAEHDDTGYRVTRASVHRLLEAGQKLSQVLAELAALSHGPLPDRLVDQIKAWGRYYGTAQLDQVWLLRLRDEAMLRELRADTEIGRLLKPLTATRGQGIAVVAPRHVDRVRKRLRELGIEVKE